MKTEQLLFNLLLSNAHTWVRYWENEEISGLDMPGEYIEVRSNYIVGNDLQKILNCGFKIEKITTQKINADAFCEVLFKRELSKKN